MTPLLSIVIPTRNREKYCIAAIEDILSYDYQAIELCVQDNSDSDQIEKYIANRERDSRLVYKRVPEQIASIFNINDSIKLATGEYVVLIGDDDTILPNIFKIVEWAKRENIDSICPTKFVTYLWPGASPTHSDGVLIIPEFTNVISKIDVAKRYNLLFRKGLIDYVTFNLPKVYHGIIKRELLTEIKNRIGSYVTGLSPDISSCIALSAVVKNHIVLDCPITIAGACKNSSTSQNLRQEHRGELSTAPHLNLRGEYHWDKMVPQFYSVETIWADSALHTVDAMHIEGFREKFNYHRFVTYALVRNRSIFRFALQKVLNDKRHQKNRCKYSIILGIVWYSQFIVYKKILNTIFNKAKSKEFDNIDNIGDAVHKCVLYDKRLGNE